MSRRVRFEDAAAVEYRLAARWYERRKPGLGTDFLDSVDACLRRVLELPGSGSPVLRVPTELGIRRMAVQRFPYHVVYLETETAIWVLAIAHDRRTPEYWIQRFR